MEEYMKNRPPKKVFSKEKIEHLRNQAIRMITSKLLPDENIMRIILIGSSVKNTFGEYEAPGFRGSHFSDFDFIIFVEDNYEIPYWFDREMDGTPFPDETMNLAYRNKKCVENTYDVEVFFIRKTHAQDSTIQQWGEEAGIPMTDESMHEHLIVYSKE